MIPSGADDVVLAFETGTITTTDVSVFGAVVVGAVASAVLGGACVDGATGVVRVVSVVCCASVLVSAGGDDSTGEVVSGFVVPDVVGFAGDDGSADNVSADVVKAVVLSLAVGVLADSVGVVTALVVAPLLFPPLAVAPTCTPAPMLPTVTPMLTSTASPWHPRNAATATRLYKLRILY